MLHHLENFNDSLSETICHFIKLKRLDMMQVMEGYVFAMWTMNSNNIG